LSSEQDRLDALAENVAQERARIDDTVKQIQHKLTTGQLIDEILRQGGEPARNGLAAIGKTISAHPVPALLIGAALVWIALEHRPEPYRSGSTKSSEA
jgi:hypothetical protein